MVSVHQASTLSGAWGDRKGDGTSSIESVVIAVATEKEIRARLSYNRRAMNQELILWPVIIQMVLTLLLFFRLGTVKARAKAAGEVDLTVTALNNDAWPDDVRKISNNIRNQFQIPVLFYVLVLALFVLESVDVFAITLAFLFAASRLVHAYIHTGSNDVPNRTRVFKVGVLCVIGLVGLLIRAIVL